MSEEDRELFQRYAQSIAKSISRKISYEDLEKIQQSKGAIDQMKTLEKIYHENYYKGKKEGILEGKMEGKMEGILEGILEGKMEAAIRFFEEGIPVEKLTQLLQIPEEKILRALKENNESESSKP